MASFRTITIKIPESHAARIEQIDGRDLQAIVEDLVMNWFNDERRRDIEVKRQGISWSRDVYAALLKHVGVGGISRFVRDAVYQDLKKSEKGLIEVPDWKEGRGKKRGVKLTRESPPDRTSLQAPIMFPAQWIERLEARYPGKVSTYIKAVTQERLESQFNISLPIQKGMKEFLNR